MSVENNPRTLRAIHVFFPIILVSKAHVSRAENQRVGTGSERHVFCFAGLRIRGQPQVEIRERGVGPWRQA